MPDGSAAGDYAVLVQIGTNPEGNPIYRIGGGFVGRINFAVWGAGPTGKRLARALERHGRRAERFVDIDPRKIGRIARGAPIVSPDGLERGAHTIVVAVGARGARDLIRAHLREVGFVEGDDYLCAS